MDLRTLGNTCVIGLFWGDEGKGKIVDVLAEHADVVVRYNGGANAGHTVVIDGERFALHLLPSGTLHPDKTGVIGPGVALDPGVLLEEIDRLAARGIAVAGRLRISTRCHVVMPYHKVEDRLHEQALSGAQRIGTTARGIGPCYADKMQRSTAIRFCDLFSTALPERIRELTARKQRLFDALYDHREQLDGTAIAEEYGRYAARLRPFRDDTSQFLHDCLDHGRHLLFEGAHGTLLDIDHGTYPFVTSSSSSALGVPSGAGVPLSAVRSCIGVVKAYTTRVGQGPFPTELHDAVGERIRQRGREFGTTTGRPRRCGWFDAVAAHYGIRLGGINQVALMHLDTLSDLDPIQVCTAYEFQQKRLSTFPAEVDILEQVRPLYQTVPGWRQEISEARSFAELPPAARDYVGLLERAVGARVSIISVGPQRHQTIFRTSPGDSAAR